MMVRIVNGYHSENNGYWLMINLINIMTVIDDE